MTQIVIKSKTMRYKIYKKSIRTMSGCRISRILLNQRLLNTFPATYVLEVRVYDHEVVWEWEVLMLSDYEASFK